MASCSGPASHLIRDLDGDAHLLQVTEAPGLISVSDDAMTRMMPVIVALELAWQIVRAATRLRQIEPDAGPPSATF